MAIGAVMMALCGTCTAYWAGGSLWSIITGSDSEGWGQMILIASAIVGGIPTLLGLLVFLEGRSRRRAAKPPPSGPPLS